MKFAILAAGEGSRLASEGVAEPKPLVRLGGEPLIDRLVRIFADNGASEILVVCNDRSPLVGRHLDELGRHFPLRHVARSTPSSMHSLYALSPLLGDEPFVLTTVDTVFDEGEFARYVEAFGQTEADALMGITDYVDDERPLYVSTDGQGRITGYGDPASAWVSAGIYGLKPPTLETLRRCVARGDMRMRQFQQSLVDDGRRVEAFRFGQVIDIDHAADLRKARNLWSRN